MKNYVLKVILLLAFASTILDASESNKDIIEILNSIPPEEKLEIKELFKNLFKNQVFSYTLYGDKPVSITHTSLNACSQEEILEILSLTGYCQEALEIFYEPASFFNKRWETWNKYKNLFKLNKYALVEKKYGSQSRIIIINIEAFKNAVNKNIDLFKKSLNENVSCEALLECLRIEKTNIWNDLDYDQGLLGILLGFGRHNAMLFEKRERLIDLLNRPLLDPFRINREIELIDKKLQPFHECDRCILASTNRVMFAADSANKETIELRTKYDKLNREINLIYSKPDWFEKTMIQLTSD